MAAPQIPTNQLALIIADVIGGLYIYATTGQNIYMPTQRYSSLENEAEYQSRLRPHTELVVHPHFGCVLRSGGYVGKEGFPATDIDLSARNHQDTFLIGLFGGSVAVGLGVREARASHAADCSLKR